MSPKVQIAKTLTFGNVNQIINNENQEKTKKINRLPPRHIRRGEMQKKELRKVSQSMIEITRERKKLKEILNTHNEMVSFSQEEFEQQLNLHLKKHNIPINSLRKSIIRVSSKSVSPINKSMPILENNTSCVLSKKSMNYDKTRITKDSTSILDQKSTYEQSSSYAEELKDEIKDIDEYFL